MQYSSLQSIINAITSPEIEVVSFDVFDTLLLRPIAAESAKFGLLDQKFHQLTDAGISFARIRQAAEAQLRRRILRNELPKEDVTIDEIYGQIQMAFNIPVEMAERLKEEEILLEYKLCTERKSGKRLFEAAENAGKRIILLSDMYLTETQIAGILEKNGYDGYEKLFVSSETGVRKQSGSLFQMAVSETGVRPERILHIGDDVKNDCEQAEKNGLRSAWLPKTADVFDRYGCAHQAEKICRDLTDWEKARKEPGIAGLRQMAANLYFDDPFRPFEEESDYNADPYFVGYAALGMEVLALIRWIAGNAVRDGAKKVVFLSRDGYLPMQVYNLYRKIRPELPEASYLYTSRLAMLPVMIGSSLDLYDLPTDISYQTPEKLLNLLEFCACPDAREKIETGKDRKYTFGASFTAESFEEFISDFIRLGYDAEKHEESKKRVSAYLNQNDQAPLEDGTALFDMGYSGRIAAAIAQASGKQLFFYYFHADGSRQFACEDNSGIKIRAFFDFSPYMESTMREYAYLEPAASCIGYSDRLEPLFDCGPAVHYEETVREMQRGALDLAEDYFKYFGQYEAQMSFRNHNAAMPFEAFLRFCSEKDKAIYQDVVIDDELWGGRRNISLNALMEARLKKLPDFAKEENRKESEERIQSVQEEQASAQRAFEMKVKETVMRESLLNWYEFGKDARLLEIGAENGELTGLFCRRCREVTAIVFSEEEKKALEQKYENLSNLQVVLLPQTALTKEVCLKKELNGQRFDHIVCIGLIEKAEDPAAALKSWVSCLKTGGTLLLETENRFGLKYFCGCKEKYTGQPFMGINGYFEGTEASGAAGIKGGRLYSRQELLTVLDRADVSGYQFYYPVPDSRMPQMIFGNEYRRGDDIVRLADYNYAEQGMLGIEHRMWKEVIESGSLPFLSNSFLIEIAAPEDLSDIEYAVITTDRGPQLGMATTVRTGKQVFKRPLWPEGEQTLQNLAEKTEELKQMGIPVADGRLRKDEYGLRMEMPFIQCESLTTALERFAVSDPEHFYRIFDQIYEWIRSSERKGTVYLDLAPCNAFYEGMDENGRDRILFYDQEFKGEGTPGFALYRTLKYFFASSPSVRKIFSLQQMMERYGITEEQAKKFEEKEAQFIGSVRQTEQFDWIRQAATPDYRHILSNMQRLQTQEKKPYAVGYVPGVFDLFHTGHLRLIERCKERCDYLIVGVLTDELVEYYKGRKPVISFEDRVAVIKGLRSADEVIAVDYGNTDKIKAWEQLHYDCHFSGDDHIGHWNDIREELIKRGSNMEFFSYTKGISTTQIRENIQA